MEATEQKSFFLQISNFIFTRNLIYKFHVKLSE